MNSIVLHIALAEGVTTAWWYRASRAGATLQELHETYTMGTSTVSSLLAGKKFNYVAMGTIFVATVPLNGFLLQNTISYVSSTCANDTQLTLSLAPRLPLGFSADMKNGKITGWSDTLALATTSWNGLDLTPAGVFYPHVNETSHLDDQFESVGCTNKNKTAVCKSRVSVVSFDMTCTAVPDKVYDLSPHSSHNGSLDSTTVFSSQVTWNRSAPNLISLDIMYKPNQTCQGQFFKKNCQFRPVLMSLPIQVNSNQGFYAGIEWANSETARPIITLDPSANLSDFQVLEEIPVYENEGETNSTYGGIAKWLAQRFDGSIDWTLEHGKWSVNSSGFLTESYQFDQYLYDSINATFNVSTAWIIAPEFNPSRNNESWCRNVYTGQDWLTDLRFGKNDTAVDVPSPEQRAHYALHQLMLGASIGQAQVQWNEAMDQWSNSFNSWYAAYEASNYSDTVPPFDDTPDAVYAKLFGNDGYTKLPNVRQTQPCLRYKMKYKYWGASVAITVFIVLMVAPLFYGFWTLDRRGTLSPFETAYAFGAPALQDADMKKGTGILLKEIGKRPALATDHTISIPSSSQSSTDTTAK